jgi:hypothetical protein
MIPPAISHSVVVATLIFAGSAGRAWAEPAPSALPNSLLPRLPRLELPLSNAPLVYDAFDRRREESSTETPSLRSDDGVYGRFEGDIFFTPYLGLERAYGGFAPAIGLRAHYFSTVGIHVSYASGALYPGDGGSQHHLSDIAAELRPLFLLRWREGLETGPSFLDLTIDSLTVGVGGFWDQRRGEGQVHRGPTLQLAASVPLTSHALGPWIGGAAIWRFPHLAAHPDEVDFAWMVRFEWTFSANSARPSDS